MLALKLLTGELTRDVEQVARFKREAEMASRLSHPNTVQVFDFGGADGLAYLAMEYVRGEDLGHIVNSSGPMPGERLAKIMIQICCRSRKLGRDEKLRAGIAEHDRR